MRNGGQQKWQWPIELQIGIVGSNFEDSSVQFGSMSSFVIVDDENDVV